MRHRLAILALSLACSWLVCPVRGTEPSEEKLFEKVMARLLAADLVQREYPSKFAWPPRYIVKPDSTKEVNAYASAAPVVGAQRDAKTGKLRPIVLVTEGMLREVIKGDENSLAVIMGHELAHLAKGHVEGRKGETALVMLAFNRTQEIEADLDGMRYAVAAGYPYKAGVAKAIQHMRTRNRTSSFEGLNDTHPSWEDRLIFLDREQAKLWSAMSAFNNGFLFLALEQYQAAKQCFKAVTAEFPDCHEGWANLGYASLMLYCDALDSDDLRRFNIGQIVAGGFYTRPTSLEGKVRGIDERLWSEAVRALNKALSLKNDLVLPRANLGLAYLVDPDGKDAKKASQYFAQAIDHLQKDADARKNPLALAALLNNSAVADLAAGNVEETAAKLESAARLTALGPALPISLTLEDGLLYNQALLEARSKGNSAKEKAARTLEKYLARASADSVWWTLAYDRYTKLAKELEWTVKSRQVLQAKADPTLLRVVASVKLGKETVTLSEPVENAVQRLGKSAGVPLPLFPGSTIVRWRFAERGLDLLARDRVLAIFLTDPKAPPVILQGSGVGANKRELRIGMSQKQALDMLQDQRAQAEQQAIADPKVRFRFYPELGIGVRFVNERLEEIAIAQIPRRSFAE